MKWKVPFTRAQPRPDHAHFAIAYKTEDGMRMEFDGQLPRDVAMRLFGEAVAARKPTIKDPK
jgi:hypothetical protein